ncbi:hypothetical protein EHS13_32265 [Paenibacillus psychroresistens]|uniref:Cache domain-containing protein n=1 Tax=Paenibacillus psychroresistens TaxID=1778678 RepID=A0A6B8RTI3_9BACL|nr:PDC sensor domain-containing protein [Paenibacillus psychroresistens]QGQ99219.1 hypothetical protein EHS13_32265 [Paenibacillus psychroresistens]
MKRLFNVKNKLIVAFTLILLLPSISLGWFSYHTAQNKLSDSLLTAAKQSTDAYKAQQSGFEYVYLASAEGIMLRSPELPKKLPKDDPRTQTWYKQAIQSPNSAIHTEPYISSTSGNTVVTIANRLEDGSGVVGVHIDLLAFSQIVSKAKIGQDAMCIF